MCTMKLILLVFSLQLCSSDLLAKYKTIKFLEKITDKVKDPSEFLANLQATLLNPTHLEKVFTMFEASDFSEKKVWNREEEKERFISVMTSEDDDELEEKLMYAEISMKKLKISNLDELDEIFTMSESLEFVLDYYKNMEQAVNKVNYLKLRVFVSVKF